MSVAGCQCTLIHTCLRCCVCFLLSQSETSQLCSTILDVLSSIYHQDTANYFILESQNTLSQFAEKIFLKPQDIQVSALLQEGSAFIIAVVIVLRFISQVEWVLKNPKPSSFLPFCTSSSHCGKFRWPCLACFWVEQGYCTCKSSATQSGQGMWCFSVYCDWLRNIAKAASLLGFPTAWGRFVFHAWSKVHKS